ncbi:MAG TPA: B12-binding domain-containing radical SAM protein [Planctomycetota bacterium]|nr:B12-binding domain-containing radical SAM protein [Planctomycetota bacterium]
MRVALVNPPWISGTTPCGAAHLPLELGYARALLGRDGHEPRVIDAHLHGIGIDAIRALVGAYAPDLTVVLTAPSSLVATCGADGLDLPLRTIEAVREVAGAIVVAGPHGTASPRAVLRALGADAVVLGECEEPIARLASTPRSRWGGVPAVALAEGDGARVTGPPHRSRLAELPALRWTRSDLLAHAHQHQRFDALPRGSGAEMETSRGFRRRPLEVVLEELDALLALGVEYVYFADGTFPPDRELLDALSRRPIRFGVRTHIDLWTSGMAERLGRSGCVSLEATVRPFRPTEELTELLLEVRQHVPFVRATVRGGATGDDWHRRLRANGVWAEAAEPAEVQP